MENCEASQEKGAKETQDLSFGWVTWGRVKGSCGSLQVGCCQKAEQFCDEYLNKFYLELGADQSEADTVIGKEAVVTHIRQEGEIFGHFCGLDNVHILSVTIHHSRRASLSDIDVL